MKRLSGGLAVVALGVATPAFAQSSVTLYGLIDEGINYNSNAGGHRLYNLSSGIRGGSRWGLSGKEDLGGDLKAIFTLESGFDVNSGKLGQGGLLFGRQAFVGLSSHLGTVTLGRQYDSVVTYVGPFEVGDQWGGITSAHPGDLDNVNNTQRVNNAIKYTSQTYGGLSFGGLYSLGGVAGSVSRDQVWSLGAGYVNGPVTLGVGYLNARNPNVSFFGSSSANANGITTPVYSGYASANTYQVIAAGGSYTIGSSTIGATYSNTKFMSLGNTAAGGPNPNHYSGDVTFNNVELNFKYQLTTAVLLGIAYDYTRGGSVNGQEGARYNQGELGAVYALSRATELYVFGVYQKASGIDSTGKAAVAAINQVTASDSDRQAVVRVGIRHVF